MTSFWNVGAIFFSLLAGLSQANLLGDTHMLKRYPQAVEVPPAAAHSPSTILPGNGSAVGTSTRVLLPTSTRQLIDATTLHSLHSRESTGVSTGTGTDGNVGGGTSVTSIEVDWTGLLPVTPSVSQSFRGTTHQPTGEDPAATELSTGTTSDPDTSFDDGVTKITQSVGVGETSTVSTPLPSQTAVDNDGGGQCGTGDGLSKKGLREACDRAINKYEDDKIYSDYVSRYSRESSKENDGIIICGHIRLSNSWTIIMDYCTNCKTRG
ncbi:hypothetical protein FocTR4_00016409 [Fusarium oxysporum f. sp. cubense]|uniref:Uncharacterized protein n=1 Tax=Fusarium oxysporum f. sp. cubense TaxID=61366 RepID=A0A5C6SAJ0_FUSOC|nr:hypothetical protein FocTR4_00016409 [Fusarium oxysporum f. sp. cubense]